ELLSFEVGSARRYCHTLPLEQFRQVGTFPKEDWAQRWLPMLSGGYLLHAQKRVHPLTPIRPMWRPARLKAVGGLEPSTRVHVARCAPQAVPHSAPRGVPNPPNRSVPNSKLRAVPRPKPGSTSQESDGE